MLVGKVILRREIHQDELQAFLTTPYSNKKLQKVYDLTKIPFLTRYFLCGHKINTDPSGRAV